MGPSPGSRPTEFHNDNVDWDYFPTAIPGPQGWWEYRTTDGYLSIWTPSYTISYPSGLTFFPGLSYLYPTDGQYTFTNNRKRGRGSQATHSQP